MKKFLVFVIAVSCFFTGYSQAIKSFKECAYNVSNTNTAHINKFIQKSLPYSKNDDNYTLTLTQTNISTAPFSFLLFKRDEALTVNKARTSVPKGYVVNDFAILEDTVIFVGNYNNVGYVAYFPISELIDAPSSQTYVNATYTPVTEEYQNNTVSRVIAYKNNNNERIVLCLGKMFYGDPQYLLELPRELGESKQYKTVIPEKTYQNFLLNFPLEQVPLPTIPTAENYILGDNINGMGYIISYDFSRWLDDKPVDNNEEFHDITVTDNYVYLLSSSYYSIADSIQWKTATSGDIRNRLILRTFNKNTLQPILSKYMETEDDDYIMSAAKNTKALIRHIRYDSVAVGYIVQEKSNPSNYHILVNFINYEDDDFVVVSSQISKTIFSIDKQPPLQDMEYNSTTKNLCLLTCISGNSHIFNLVNDPFSSDYTAEGLFIERWCNTSNSDFRDLFCNNNYMTITGVCNTAKVCLIDKRMSALEENKYFYSAGLPIKIYDTFAVWDDRQFLSKCVFSPKIEVNQTFTSYRYAIPTSLSMTYIKNITLIEN